MCITQEHMHRKASHEQSNMQVVLADGSIGEVEPSKTEIELPSPRTVLHTEVLSFENFCQNNIFSFSSLINYMLIDVYAD